MMMWSTLHSLSARASSLLLFLVALKGLVPVDPSLIPPPRTSSGRGSVHLATEPESDSPVRRTSSNINGVSAHLDSQGCPFPHHPALSLPPGREGPKTPGSVAPSVTGRAPPGRERRRTGRRRRRRSEVLDTSDPLCLHTQRGRCSLTQEEEQKPQEPEPEPDPSEQSHAVSKETITSTSDDPLNVVQPPEGGGSPRSVGTDKALTKRRTTAEGEAQA